VSEVDVNGDLLRTFTDVEEPRYLSAVSNGDILVADLGNHRILLLNSQLRLERVFINTDSEVQPWKPRRLYLNELSSELYVLHRSSTDDRPVPHIISKFIPRWCDKLISQISAVLFRFLYLCFLILAPVSADFISVGDHVTF